MQAIVLKCVMSEWRVDDRAWSKTTAARLRTALCHIFSALGKKERPSWARSFMKNDEKEEEKQHDGEASEGAELAEEASGMDLPSEHEEEEEEDNRIVQTRTGSISAS
jgi:hypothetical protein